MDANASCVTVMVVNGHSVSHCRVHNVNITPQAPLHNSDCNVNVVHWLGWTRRNERIQSGGFRSIAKFKS